MHKMNELRAIFVALLLVLPLAGQADSIQSTEPLNSIGPTKTAPVYNSANLGAVGFKSLRQDFKPKEGMVVANAGDLDCKNATTSGGWDNKTIFCPPGYILHEMQASRPSETNLVYWAIEGAAGTVYYQLRCCKAHVTYS